MPYKEGGHMELTILIGAIVAVFVAFNLYDKSEQYGRLKASHIIVSITAVIAAVLVGNFLDHMGLAYHIFPDSNAIKTRY